MYIYIYIDSCNFVKLSPVTHISERSCEWKERERKEKNSTRRLRQCDFLRRSKKRETDLPLLLLLLQGTGFVSRVQKKRGRRRRRGRRTFAEERTREKRGDKEREGDVDIHRPGFWLDKERVRDTAGTHYDRWNTVLRVPPQSRPHPRNRRTCHSFVLNPGPFSNPRARATSSSNGIVSLPCIHPPPLTLISILSFSLSCQSRDTRRFWSRVSSLGRIYTRWPCAYWISERGEAPSKEGRFFVKKITGFEGPNVTWPAIIISRGWAEDREGFRFERVSGDKSLNRCKILCWRFSIKRCLFPAEFVEIKNPVISNFDKENFNRAISRNSFPINGLEMAPSSLSLLGLFLG